MAGQEANFFPKSQPSNQQENNPPIQGTITTLQAMIQPEIHCHAEAALGIVLTSGTCLGSGSEGMDVMAG